MPATVNAPTFWIDKYLDEMIAGEQPDQYRKLLLPGNVDPNSMQYLNKFANGASAPAIDDPNKVAGDASWIDQVLRKYLELNPRITARASGGEHYLPKDYTSGR